MSEARSAPAVPATSLRRVMSVSRLTTPVKMRAVSMTRAVTTPSAALSLCRFSTGKSTTAVAVPASPTITSDSAPAITPLVLPAPRTKSAWSFAGSYSHRVGMDTKVITYSTPARRALPLIASGVTRVAAGACGVMALMGWTFCVGVAGCRRRSPLPGVKRYGPPEQLPPAWSAGRAEDDVRAEPGQAESGRLAGAAGDQDRSAVHRPRPAVSLRHVGVLRR